MTDRPDYTPEEAEALPQLATILKEPNLQVHDHIWLQQGYHIIDQCCDGQAIAIPSGKMLVKTDGRYDLVDEVR